MFSRLKEENVLKKTNVKNPQEKLKILKRRKMFSRCNMKNPD
jgi:hypothetical protein